MFDYLIALGRQMPNLKFRKILFFYTFFLETIIIFCNNLAKT